MQNSFHNTTGITGAGLALAEGKARSQESKILGFMVRNANRRFTPFELLDELQLNCPFTSVRRALTNLTNRGLIKKTAIQKMERYGMANHTWCYVEKGEQGVMVFG